MTASYGLLYFSYKFLIPWSGTNDFRHYYWMDRAPFNFQVAPSPFVLRQGSAVLTWLVWKAHIYYPNDIWFSDPRYDQRVFFAALFANWVCLVLAALVAGRIAETMLGRRSFLAALLAGLVCVLSFHTQFVVISGDTEGLSWLLMAVGFLAYLRNREWVVAGVVAVAIVQREAVIVALGLVAGFDLVRRRGEFRGMRLRIVAWALLCFAVYLLLRHVIPGNGHQVRAAGVLASLGRLRLTRAMLFQSFLNQNVVLLALGAAGAARIRGAGAPSGSGGYLPLLLATWGCLAFLAACAGLDVDVGRIAGITIPLFAASAAVDLVRAEGERLASPTGFEPVLPPGTGGVLGR